MVIGDVTPPLFVMGTPHAEGHGPKSLSVSVAASEHHSAYHVVILPSGASPPRTAVEVYTGVLAENAANSEIVFKDSGSVPFFNITSLTFFGDMSPGVAYTIYMTLADKHGNVNPVVQTVQMFTKYCMSCPALMVLAGGSACDCVVPAIFTLACSDNRKGAGEEQGRTESVRRRATRRGCVAGGNAVMGALA